MAMRHAAVRRSFWGGVVCACGDELSDVGYYFEHVRRASYVADPDSTFHYAVLLIEHAPEVMDRSSVRCRCGRRCASFGDFVRHVDREMEALVETACS